ncbi:MAG: hypothetical protein FWF86_02455 [Clostridia bacterium]|nr:hypothetical protein [Clostridia bacterium]
MRIVYKREFHGFFYTPVGYVFIGVFLGLSGALFYMSNLRPLSGELLLFLSQLTMLLMLLCPMLTMRLCEERQKGTDQLLLTSPVPLAAIVWGKYFAAATVLLLGVLLTHVYVLVIGLFGTVFAGEWFVGYLGLTLQGLSFLALDLLVAGFAGNQVSAVIAAFAANLVLWLLDLLARYVPIGFVREALFFISLYGRYEPFVLGQLSFASVLFFLTFIAVCVTVALRWLDSRRFAKGAGT